MTFHSALREAPLTARIALQVDAVDVDSAAMRVVNWTLDHQ